MLQWEMYLAHKCVRLCLLIWRQFVACRYFKCLAPVICFGKFAWLTFKYSSIKSSHRTDRTDYDALATTLPQICTDHPDQTCDACEPTPAPIQTARSITITPSKCSARHSVSVQILENAIQPVRDRAIAVTPTFMHLIRAGRFSRRIFVLHICVEKKTI